jgi:hypothetical protein
MKNSVDKYRKTPKGLLTNIYSKMKERSLKNNRPLPNFSLLELHNKFLNDKEYMYIFDEWANNGYLTSYKPSIDRINPDLPYTLDNIQIMTWKNNREKGDLENSRRITTAIVMYDLDGNKIKEFESIKEAIKETGLNLGNIIACCQGKRNHTGNYKFKYRGDKFRKKSIGNIHEEILLQK